jgi:hypothetical protein
MMAQKIAVQRFPFPAAIMPLLAVFVAIVMLVAL